MLVARLVDVEAVKVVEEAEAAVTKAVGAEEKAVEAVGEAEEAVDVLHADVDVDVEELPKQLYDYEAPWGQCFGW